MSTAQQKLPPKEEDHIIEVSMKHVVLAFGGIVIGSIAIGTGISFARECAKYKRQKAMIDAAGQLLTALFHGGEIQWNEQSKESSSPKVTSRKPERSLDGSASVSS